MSDVRSVKFFHPENATGKSTQQGTDNVGGCKLTEPQDTVLESAAGQERRLMSPAPAEDMIRSQQPPGLLMLETQENVFFFL